MDRMTARELACRMVFELDFGAAELGELFELRFSRDIGLDLGEEDEAYREPPGKKQEAYIKKVVSGVREHQPELDGYIEKYSIGWNFDRIARIGAAILRVCMFEVLYMDDIPDKAALNAAVEISKRYLDDDGPAFVNGVLGAFYAGEKMIHEGG